MAHTLHAATEVALGVHHPSTLYLADVLTGVWRAQGRLTEADALCQRTLTALEETHGTSHPDVWAAVHKLAELRVAQADALAAEALYRRALTGREAHLGAAHQSTLESARKLIALLRERACHPDANALEQRFALARISRVVHFSRIARLARAVQRAPLASGSSTGNSTQGLQSPD